MKRGTKIEVRGTDLNGREVWEPATVIRGEPMTHYADGSDYPGWHLLKYADGGRSVTHENRVRVVDNRA